MADVILAQIDLARLAASLSVGEGRPVDAAEAEQFLRELGFTRHSDGWVGEDVSLQGLNADEVLGWRAID